MASAGFLEAPRAAPELNVPRADATVRVAAIDTTTRLKIQFPSMLTPHIKGHDALYCPSYSFLISNGDTHVLFDLGVRKDLSKGPPAIPERVKNNGWTCETEKDVAEILDEHAPHTGVASKDIDAVILSHHHFDHTGNLGLFPASTKVVVGPGFKDAFLPGYPSDPKSFIYGPEYENRTVMEARPENSNLQIGRFDAVDYFGDGSLYLLSSPGHTLGHMCAFARVTTSPPTFILMGGDAAHHAGILRPTPYLPLPREITPSPFPRFRPGACPGELLQQAHPEQSATKPFYSEKAESNYNYDDMVKSVEKMTELDACEQVFTVIAHDFYLLEHMPLFPKPLNDWYEMGLDGKTRWEFARDFADPGEGAQA